LAVKLLVVIPVLLMVVTPLMWAATMAVKACVRSTTP
jgi:hypothetical protein